MYVKCISLYVWGTCYELLFAVHAILSEAFSEGVGVDLQLCDLKTTTKQFYSWFIFSLLLYQFALCYI